jgi:hypothetical protein
MMAGLKLAMAPGVEVPVTFLGLAMIVRGALTGIAVRWILQGKAEGLFLAGRVRRRHQHRAVRMTL